MKTPLLHIIVWGLVCAAALSSFGYWYAVIAEKSLTVAELQGQIDGKIETANRISTARATLLEIAEDEAAVRNYFVPEAGVVAFINDLEKRARAQGATLKVLSVSAGVVAKQPVLILSLALEGGFDPVMRTLGAIEFAPYDLFISELTMGENGKGVWNASIKITVGSVPSTSATSTQAVPPKILSLHL